MVVKIVKNVEALPKSLNQVDLQYKKSNRCQVSLTVQGGDLSFRIDTGSNYFVGINHDTFVRLKASGAISEDISQAGVLETVAGLSTGTAGHFNRGAIWGVELKDTPVQDSGAHNILGMEFLLSFNFAFDLPHSMFYFERRACEPPVRYAKMFGAMLRFYDGRNHVFKLNPGGGAAADAGLKVWDRIVRLGPLTESTLNLISLYELCLNHAGEALEVEFTRPGAEKPMITQLKLPAKEFLYPRQTTR